MSPEELLAAYDEMDRVEYEKLPVPGYVGYYADTNGDIWGKRGVKLAAPIGCKGYRAVNTISPDGYETVVTVHILVCLAFHGPKPEGLEVCHEDDVKTNNIPSNLYYGTHKKNGEDAVKNGKIAYGENSSRVKLTDDLVLKIREHLKLGRTLKSLAKEFCVSSHTIGSIRDRLTWKHI